MFQRKQMWIIQGHRKSHNILSKRSISNIGKSNYGLALAYLKKSINLVNFNINLVIPDHIWNFFLLITFYIQPVSHFPSK